MQSIQTHLSAVFFDYIVSNAKLEKQGNEGVSKAGVKV